MAKPEWGMKRICKKCSTAFYDMQNNPIICPKCMAEFSASDFTSRYAKNSDKVEQRRETKNVAAEVNDEDVAGWRHI